MLYREITYVCSQIHAKHINTLCGQNVELLNVKCRYRVYYLNVLSAEHISLCVIQLRS